MSRPPAGSFKGGAVRALSWGLAPLTTLLLYACESDAPSCDATEGLDLYARRIEPILADDRPKTCNQCHLSGVDLGLFVRDTPCQTMACMVDQGLANLDAPSDSLILTWISRAEPDSELITEDVIAEEREGFLEWIEFHARCNDEVCPAFDDPCGFGAGRPTCDTSDVEVQFSDPESCEDLALEEMFFEAFYVVRGRCSPCHYDADVNAPPEAPKWIEVEGDCDAASLATMRNVLDRGYVSLDDPASSLILQKPLAEDAGGIEHGGGEKFHDTDEEDYVNLRAWVERMAACAE